MLVFMGVATTYMVVAGYRWNRWRFAMGGVALLWALFALTRLYVMSAEPLAHLVLPLLP